MARLAENGPVLGAVVGIGLEVVTSGSAVAQFTRPTAPNERQVYLVREDAPDCQNSHIRNADSDLVSGNVRVTRMRDENTSVKVAITAVPRATYHFFLKCV